jgi:hypothetical protein
MPKEISFPKLRTKPRHYSLDMQFFFYAMFVRWVWLKAQTCRTLVKMYMIFFIFPMIMGGKK